MSDQLYDILAHKRVISEARAAELAGFSLIHFRRLRKRGLGPRFVRLTPGRRIHYQVGAVLEWLDAHTCDPAA